MWFLLQIFAARTFTLSTSERFGFSMLYVLCLALGVVYTTVTGSEVTEATMFCGVLAGASILYSLQPFLLTIHINNEYERADLQSLSSSMVVLTQRLSYVANSLPASVATSPTHPQTEELHVHKFAAKRATGLMPFADSSDASNIPLVNPIAAAGHFNETPEMIHGRLMLIHRHLQDYKSIPSVLQPFSFQRSLSFSHCSCADRFISHRLCA